MWLYVKKGYGSALIIKNKAFGATDLSKPLDSLRDNSLIANFHANGFDLHKRA